jgi:toxin ParE1/3/4
MANYSFTPEVLDDLHKIVLYTVDHWGKGQAIHSVDGIHLQASRLAQTPKIGQDRSTLYQGLLSFPFASHILYYVKSANGIVIVRVLHKSMDTAKYF